MIACCGLNCNECGAFIATQTNDDAKRAEVAAAWSKEYNKTIHPEDIVCDGCQSDTGNVFSYCKVCEIRSCVNEKGLETCADCPKYACERLQEFFKLVPVAQDQLNKLRDN